MAVTPEDVRHVAQLARMGIPEADLAVYVSQLNGILAHMEVLAKVEPGAVADAAEAAREGMRTRPDVLGAVKLEIPREQFAPQMKGGFFLVPRLATHEDSGEES
ncbi:MAG: aspartyl/glutamyl-tRNA amidotransferase subunit C [Gemmatimonadetes bacterium]|nr:aspartyl/glutamyl-tRNA amidotransferase subunit C [Gemmatimonadota bacterium]